MGPFAGDMGAALDSPVAPLERIVTTAPSMVLGAAAYDGEDVRLRIVHTKPQGLSWRTRR